MSTEEKKKQLSGWDKNPRKVYGEMLICGGYLASYFPPKVCKRLMSLPKTQQDYIAGKYYGGIRYWEKAQEAREAGVIE